MESSVVIEKIVSGGQSGADRAARDWALAKGVPHEGWCPRGRKAEDGAISAESRLRETPTGGYIVRTEWNVRDSDATVIFSIAAKLSGGSLVTHRFAKRHRRPCLHLSREATPDPAGELAAFAERYGVRVLNVAGPRASGEPEIAAFVGEVLEAAFGTLL